MNWRFFLFGCHLDDVHSIKTCFFFSLYVRANIISRFICLFFFSYKMILLFGSWSNFSMMLVSRYICSHSLCVRFFFFRKTENWIRDKRTECFCKWYFFYQFFSWIPTPRKTFGKNCCHRKCTEAMKYLVLHVVAVCYSPYWHANKRPQDQLGYE